MNSGEALDNDGSSSQMPGLQRSMLSAGALTVVVVSDHHPGHTVGLHTTAWKAKFILDARGKYLTGEKKQSQFLFYLHFKQ